MGYVVRLEWSNGDRNLIYIMRPFIQPCAKENCRVMGKIAQSITEDPRMGQLYWDLIQHGKRTVAMECDVMLAPQQYRRARELFGRRRAFIDGQACLIDGVDAYCPASLRGEDLARHDYFLMDEAQGLVLTRYLPLGGAQAKINEKLSELPSIIPLIMCNLTGLLSAVLSGEKICYDRHDGNVVVDGQVALRHVDLKLQPLDSPSRKGREQFGEVLGRILLAAPEQQDLLTVFYDYKAAKADFDPYLDDLKRTFMALRPQFEVLSPEQNSRVLISAIVDRARREGGIHGEIKKGLLSVLGPKLPPLVQPFVLQLLDQGIVPQISPFLLGFAPPVLQGLIAKLGLEKISTPGYLIRLEELI
jgi:hypothetical protein